MKTVELVEKYRAALNKWLELRRAEPEHPNNPEPDPKQYHLNSALSRMVKDETERAFRFKHNL